VERKREEKRKARVSFTDGVSSSGGEEAEATTRGECGGSGGQGRVKV
jgi:hypothetical protein